MTPQVVLLRGINLGERRRIAMAELRDALQSTGMRDVRTYLQSGNVVLLSDELPKTLERTCEQLIARRFELEVNVTVRTRDELAEVVRRNPLQAVAADPKRYQVSFCSEEPDPDAVRAIAAADVAPEQFVAIGRELYAWHPAGMGRSRLAALLSERRLGTSVTARNWTTVINLLEMVNG